MTDRLGRRPLTDEEVKNLIDHFDDPRLYRRPAVQRDRITFYLGLHTGFRISEICNLRWKHLYDFESDRFSETINLPKSNVKQKSQARLTWIAEGLMKELARWKRRWAKIMERDPEPDDFIVICTHKDKGGHVSTKSAWRMFMDRFRRANPDADTKRVGTHSLRKRFAKNAYEDSGCDVMFLKGQLGHKNINTTIMYLENTNEKKLKDFALNRRI